jgi:hypothetical protein
VGKVRANRWRMTSGVGGGGGRETVNRKRKLSAVFLQPMQNSSYMSRIAAMHIIFTRIAFTLFTCDMYMCRLRHINDSVLSSLKMEGICLLFMKCYI